MPRALEVTAGAIFDRTRTRLTVWFEACWLFTTDKDGVSAMATKRKLELHSYETACALLLWRRTARISPESSRSTKPSVAGVHQDSALVVNMARIFRSLWQSSKLPPVSGGTAWPSLTGSTPRPCARSQ